MATENTDTIRRVTTPAGDAAWLVTAYDQVRGLLADARLGRSHPDPESAARYSESVILGQAADLTPEEEHDDHFRMRRVLSRSFSARRLEILRPRVQAITDQLFDALAQATPPADFHDAVSFPLPALVICELLGVPYEHHDDFRGWSEDIAHMTDAARSRRGWESIQSCMRGLLERKRSAPAEDVLSDLAEDPSIDDDGAVAIAGGLLFAGHETTMSAIDRGVLLVLTNPEQREALARDPELVRGAVEEILRKPSPVRRPREARNGGLPRFASADIEVGEVTIQAGDLVLLQLQSANSDERRFPDSDRFEVRREQNAHLAFGHGPHFCIGAPLARIELQSVFGTLLQRFPGLRLAVPVEDIKPRLQQIFGGIDRLPVTW
jgi:cytochrome P450